MRIDWSQWAWCISGRRQDELSMADTPKRDPDLEWLDHIQPVGLVVAPVLLKELGLTPSRQTQADTGVVADSIDDDPTVPALKNAWSFFEQVLGWETQHVAGSPGGPDVPGDLYVRLPEQDTTLSPTWAVKELGKGEKPWQLLVRVEPAGIDPDARGSAEGWEATPHQRFERLLRETGVFAGLLISEKNKRQDGADRYSPELRLVYAPRGETSGHLNFPLRDLGKVAGRPMLGGLKLLLDSFRLFADASDRRLPALLKESREAQAAVSTALAEQVLGALHELLRGLDASEPDLIRELARSRPEDLYEGLLTVLMRLVFILYAEDRDLLPSRTDGRARQIYEMSYAVRSLYARLSEDAALNPDTMDERRGGWGRLLALFRLIHKGHPSHFVQARGGKLFDPDQFPFLEGRADAAAPLRVPAVSDGCVLRILEGLMTLQAKGGVRERLSYRTLDVEQIGSVYQTVMGFTVETAGGRSLAIRAGKNNRTPVYVNLEKLVAIKGNDRIKFLKEEADRGQTPPSIAKTIKAAKTVADMASALDPIVDERGSPKKHHIASGTPILQPTDERRRTGSHYTPRSLTEPIVRHALEPAFDRLGQNATPAQILDLKVCDPAMGSGAFLVEACRELAVRLIEAWRRHSEKKPLIPPDEDEELHARRLVAQRCLYGVDKNPLAVDLAKLSLWLATLARDHEFTFLDHALKSGDSLVGLTQEQAAAAHWDTSKPGLPLFRQLVKDRITDAMKGRAEIQAAPDDTARAIQEQRHRSLESRLKDIRLIGDAVIAAFFAADKPRAREVERAKVESWMGGSPVAWDKLTAMAATLKQGAHPLSPFHWEIEFPEVFVRENGGFDTLIGNPPYLGGTKISGANSPQYFKWIATNVMSDGDKADLIAYFIRRLFMLLRRKGTAGLVTTSSIAEGDTRKSALVWARQNEGQIYRAFKKESWPGEANVDISRIHIAKGFSISPCVLEGEQVTEINSFLNSESLDYEPFRLKANEDNCFEGFVPYGEGFVIDDYSAGASSEDEIADLVRREPQSAEVIFPYLGGEEVTESPTIAPARRVIYLAQMPEAEVRKRYSAIYGLLERKVRAYRMSKSARVAKAPWWQFLWSRPSLYKKMCCLDAMIVTSRVSKHHAFVRIPTRLIPSTRLSVITLAGLAPYAIIQCRVHEVWTRYFGASRGATANYSPSDCFENFPFPASFGSSSVLESAGQAYHDHRAALMVNRNEGMTKTYNRFHDSTETAEDIQHLRDLHAAMDRAVLGAYGWHDLAARAAPIFLDETNEDDHTYQGRLFWPSDFRDKVLARLLTLNAERHAEEVRLGIAPGMKGKAEEADDEDAQELESGK
jgi:hypothetical protein